jgi:predicted 2-oxoglutarate/Fe(II)-dependent dioxygenase YbiX
MDMTDYGAGIVTIANFLSATECAEFIGNSERTGYDEAAIQVGQGQQQVIKDVRNNDRIIFDDPQLADFIFSRARPLLPDAVPGWKPIGLNERLRFYRYTPGQYFKWHIDGAYHRSPDEVSQLTLLIYLNADYQGGATEFTWDTIAPQLGMALVFPHQMRHQGTPLTAGIKYVLRTDVMYRRMS